MGDSDGVGVEHALATHVSLTQSLSTAHASPIFSHGGHWPPQSMSVSSPFRTSSTHETGVGCDVGRGIGAKVGPNEGGPEGGDVGSGCGANEGVALGRAEGVASVEKQ